MLNKTKIEQELRKLGIETPKIVFYETTDSTNTRAKEYAKEHPDSRETVIFVADHQSAGRGRMGRSFVSNANAGIYLSILTYPDDEGFDVTKSTARAAVLLSSAIESLCKCKIGIKWVNDLYLGGKKLAGILTEGEMTPDGKIAYQVVGMGINVYRNAVSDEISTIATSLEAETNWAQDRSKLVAAIIKKFIENSEDLYVKYRERSIIIGKNVTVIKLNESYSAKVIDINPDFSLTVERNGVDERLFSGEISLKI